MEEQDLLADECAGGESTTFLPDPRRRSAGPRASGKPWRTCQRMFGRKRRSAIAAADPDPGSRELAPLAASGAERLTNAARKRSVECLFSIPSPASTPNQSQSRELPVRTIRMTKKTHPIQKSDSNPFIVRMLSTAEVDGRGERAEPRERLGKAAAAHLARERASSARPAPLRRAPRSSAGPGASRPAEARSSRTPR